MADASITVLDARSPARARSRPRPLAGTLARARASVRFRVTVAVVLLVALVLGVGAALLLRSVEQSVRRQVEQGNRDALGQFTMALQGEGIGGEGGTAQSERGEKGEATAHAAPPRMADSGDSSWCSGTT